MIKDSTLPADDPLVQAALEKMTSAFHEFHDQIMTLKRREHDIASSIRQRIDREKLDHVQAALRDALDTSHH